VELIGILIKLLLVSGIGQNLIAQPVGEVNGAGGPEDVVAGC